MTENRSPSEGTIRDSRPGESLDASDAPRINLSVLNVSHERFRIIKTYAQGGLGVVSIAQDIELDRMVAVKEMRLGRPSDDEIQRFLLEARLTGQLDHPGIPPVYAMGYFEDGRPFYAMRLVDGVTLRFAVKDFHAKYPPPDLSRQRSMQLRHLLGAVVSVCNTLRFAHSKGVLHRDIKPSNIMLGEYGETLLMDWGLAKSQKQSLPYSDMEAKAYQQRKRLEDPEDTGTGSVMGTPHYMSPEQATGDVESINQRSEVYSLGATLYSVLTGKPPFSGQTRDEILEKVRLGEFLPPRAVDRRVPPELNAICLKAMALERGDRYADTGELATDIEHWLADESVSCYRESPMRRGQRWIRAHQAWAAGLAVLLATCVVGLMIGTFLVSIKHGEAVAASKRADQAIKQADTITQQSRDLLSRTFVTTFNSRLRNVPGTERTRLEVLELFIGQFKNWSQAAPESFRDRHELALAIYERALIYAELNEIDFAWADLHQSLHILEGLSQSPDFSFRNSLVLDRAQLQTEIVTLMSEFPHSGAEIEERAQSTLYWLQRISETMPESLAYRLQLANATFQVGLAKHKRGQHNEAFELISRASSLYANLCAPNLQFEVNKQIFEGTNAIRVKALKCRCELAKVASHLGEAQLAAREHERIDTELTNMRVSSPNLFALQLLKFDNDLAKSRVGYFDKSNQTLRVQLEQLESKIEVSLKSRPQHRKLLEMLVDAQFQLATAQLFEGDIEAAQATVLSARLPLRLFSQLGTSLSRSLELIRIGQETQAIISQSNGENANEVLIAD